MTEETQTDAQLDEQQLKELASFLAASGSTPQAEEKYNVHLFLHRVATSDDTTKTGNLDEKELGLPKYPVRALKEMALISEDLVQIDGLKDYFLKESEILTSTSLSKNGFLVTQATTTTRQIADVTKKKMTSNKGWFKKKEPQVMGEQSG